MEIASGRIWGVLDYSKRWHVSHGEASKRISTLEAAARIRTEMHGSRKMVVWVDGIVAAPRIAA